MVGPTVHSLLIDVLLRFYLHYIVLTGDMSKKYSAVKLTIPDRDYYWFDWRSDKVNHSRTTERLILPLEYLLRHLLPTWLFNKMHWITWADISSPPQLQRKHSNSQTGTETPEEAIQLRIELQELFDKAQFVLHKWNSSSSAVLQRISPELRERRNILSPCLMG